ncbi:MAG: DUF4349 domain-containing protein, partial [Lachnospiraceae bacterium]
MKKKIWMAVGLLGVLLLGGCGSKNAAMESVKTEANGYYDTYSTQSGAVADFAIGEVEKESAWSLGSGSMETPSVPDGETTLYDSAEEKLIRTVTMRLQTKEFETLLSYLEGKVAQVGGYVEYSRIYGDNAEYSGYRSAEITLRIPQSRLDEFVSGVGENAAVVYKTENAENVTLQYADTESRLKALQIEQERFLALLEKAENIETILTLEEHLTELRYEIESYATRLRVYDNQVSYSTVSLSISEVKRTTPVEQDPSLFSRMKEGFIDTCYNVQDGASNFLVWLVTNFLYLLIWGVLIAVAVLIIKKYIKKAVAKK